MAASVPYNDSNTDRWAAVPVLPALGGKLNRTMPTLRSAREARRIATSLPTRAASMVARSGQECMSAAEFDAVNVHA